MSTIHYSLVGDKAWNQWNHGTSAKPWNACRKTVEVPREIRRLPSTIYTHPTANLVSGNFNEHVGYTTLWVCCSLTSGSLSSLESLLNQRKWTFSSRLIPCASNLPKARQAQKPAQKQKWQKSSARGNFKTAPKQEKITNARVLLRWLSRHWHQRWTTEDQPTSIRTIHWKRRDCSKM
jgi:hypothetical protein